MDIYVNQKSAACGIGTKERPFKTISEAAQTAKAGDNVLVYPGVYREWVNPKNGGESDEKRITYRSVEPKAAVITGAEQIKGWESMGDGVWKVSVSNGLFGGYNPYTTLVEGDWYVPAKPSHTGEVFLNNKSLYEVYSLEDVKHPTVYKPSWDPEFSVYTWYTEQEDGKTAIYANFHECDPNAENVEINVRENCFYPSETGRNYITLSGFTINKAATQWAPPTAYQEGMVGPHWAKGWIIEDCEISHSKCSGISLGKYRQPQNDNKWLKWKYKDGTQTERECILLAQLEGWTKENIGSHIIRRCDIHDCGQTGIVGHLGGVFSIIEDNHIHHINNKQNLAGAEIGGIKMHAAIDVIYRRNHIHHCTRGLWLDWQAQGTRVTQNIFHDNTLPNLRDYEGELDMSMMMGTGEDIFVEVSHGPTLIDNNLLLSTFSLKLATQGVACVHNLIAGGITAVGIGTDNGAKTLSSPRYTPYHVAHRTEVMGFMTFLHGDMRFYNNIFVQQEVDERLKATMDLSGKSGWADNNCIAGTFRYDSYPTQEEWEKEFEGYCGMGSSPSDRYYMHLPVWCDGNVYLGGAKPWEKETNCAVSEEKVSIEVSEDGCGCTVKTDLCEKMPEITANAVSTETLGMAFEPEEKFENPDGSPIFFNYDFFGNHRSIRPTPGPFEDISKTEYKL